MMMRMMAWMWMSRSWIRRIVVKQVSGHVLYKSSRTIWYDSDTQSFHALYVQLLLYNVQLG